MIYPRLIYIQLNLRCKNIYYFVSTYTNLLLWYNTLPFPTKQRAIKFSFSALNTCHSQPVLYKLICLLHTPCYNSRADLVDIQSTILKKICSIFGRWSTISCNNSKKLKSITRVIYSTKIELRQ